MHQHLDWMYPRRRSHPHLSHLHHSLNLPYPGPYRLYFHPAHPNLQSDLHLHHRHSHPRRFRPAPEHRLLYFPSGLHPGPLYCGSLLYNKKFLFFLWTVCIPHRPPPVFSLFLRFLPVSGLFQDLPFSGFPQNVHYPHSGTMYIRFFHCTPQKPSAVLLFPQVYTQPALPEDLPGSQGFRMSPVPRSPQSQNHLQPHRSALLLLRLILFPEPPSALSVQTFSLFLLLTHTPRPGTVRSVPLRSSMPKLFY